MSRIRVGERMKRRGMAIIIALAFCFTLMVFVFGIYSTHRNVSQRGRLSLQQQQAFFAARSAIQHFLLKAKLCPTELYDAVEFSQGKNPLFDFTEYPRRTDSNEEAFADVPGYVGVLWMRVKPQQELDAEGIPKFYYKRITFPDGRPECFLRIGSFFAPEFRFIAPSIFDATNEANKYTKTTLRPDHSSDPGKFLRFLYADCSNATAPVTGWYYQPALKILRAPNVNAKDWPISSNLTLPTQTSLGEYPYTMIYRVEGVSLGTMRELRRYNEEAIEIKVTGTIVDFQNRMYTQTQTRTTKITRKGSL